MLAEERRQQILQMLELSNSVTISNLSETYDVSEMTIRRDLETLEENQLLRRTRGGAVKTNSSPQPHFMIKRTKNADIKNRLAKYAVEKLVQNDEIIILEGGTTITAMVPYLKNYPNLTIITNGLYTLLELQELLPYSTVICPGGILREVAQAFVGPITERYFQEFHASKAFLSAFGISMQAGFTDISLLEAQVKRNMLASASQLIVLIDSSKYDTTSLCPAFSLDDIDVLVTDDGIPDRYREEFERHNIKVMIVPRN